MSNTARSKSSHPQRYIPALRFDWLTQFYDPVVRVTTKEEKFKALLVAQANLSPGQRVLDVGCGTGTLMIMLKRAQPLAQVLGLDGDANVLKLAKRKLEAAGIDAELSQGMASAPPFDDGSFDRVVSSLFFHHLATADKKAALARARRLLRAGGELHIADWGKAQNIAMRAAFVGVQLLDGFATTTDNVTGMLPTYMRDAGFSEVQETHREMTLLGTISLYRAVAQ